MNKSKVAKELKEVTGVEEITNFTDFAGKLSEERLEKLHYLHASITETLKLCPAVPVDAKICFSDDTLPDGNSVTKADMITYQPYAMGRTKFLWGDAEEFKPELMLSNDSVFKPESPFKFTAFQAGPWICLGREFDYQQMKIFAAVLLSIFEFKMSDDNKVVCYRTMINLRIDGGLDVRLYKKELKIS